MKDYVYISKTKIDMLYDQLIDGEDSVEYSLEGGVSIGVAKGKGVHKFKRTTTLYQKLEIVLSKLNDIGSIFDDSEYIKGSLAMSWNMKREINENSKATFWMGGSSDESGMLSKLLLIGSFHNIVGNDASSSYYWSTSYIDAFFNYSLEQQINFETLESVSTGQLLNNKASEDRSNLDEVLKRYNNKLPPEVDDYIKTSWLNRGYLAEYIDELEGYYYGEYCEYDFVAKFLHSELRYVEDVLVRYIVATPIFVSRRTQRGNRIVIDKEQKKYFLTSKEFEQHEKRKYESLHMVLHDAGLKKESESFTTEMKHLYNSLGRSRGLLNLKTNKAFMEAATAIVNKYFIVQAKSKE